MGSVMGIVAILISLLVFFAVAAVIIAVVIHITKKNKQISWNRHRYICPKCGANNTGGVCTQCGFRYLQG